MGWRNVAGTLIKFHCHEIKETPSYLAFCKRTQEKSQKAKGCDILPTTEVVGFQRLLPQKRTHRV